MIKATDATGTTTATAIVPPGESPLELEEAAPVCVGEAVPVDELMVEVSVVDPVAAVGEAVEVEVTKIVVGPGAVSEAVVEVDGIVVEVELEELVEVDVELVEVDELVLDEEVEELVVLEKLDVEVEEADEVGSADVVELAVGTAELEGADIL